MACGTGSSGARGDGATPLPGMGDQAAILRVEIHTGSAGNGVSSDKKGSRIAGKAENDHYSLSFVASKKRDGLTTNSMFTKFCVKQCAGYGLAELAAA